MLFRRAPWSGSQRQPRFGAPFLRPSAIKEQKVAVLNWEGFTMNCREFSDYIFYCLPTCEADLLPTEAQEHLEVCPECRAKVAELRSAFELLRQKEKGTASQAKESLARILTRVQERLKRGDLGQPSEESEVDCQKVKPLLSLATDPLEMMVLPAWLEEHLAACNGCWQEFQRLEEVRRIMVAAEMPPLVVDKVLDDAPPEFLKKVQDLRAIQLRQITCEQARPYYRDVATCIPEIPLEVYRHIRHCTSCKEQIKQLRSELDLDIPQVGTEKFEQLRLQPDSSGPYGGSPRDTIP